MKKFAVTMVLLIVLVSVINAGQDQKSPVLNYQGRLTDSLGNPVPDTPHTVKFSIFNDSTGGTDVWFESQVLTPEDGVIKTFLGIDSPLTIDIFLPTQFSPFKYLEIEVESETIAPREPFTCVAEAVYAPRVHGDIFTNPGVIIVPDTGSTDTIVTISPDVIKFGVVPIELEGPTELKGDVRFDGTAKHHNEVWIDVDEDGTQDFQVLDLTSPTVRIDSGTNFDIHGKLIAYNEVITNDKVTMNDSLESVNIVTQTMRVNTIYNGLGQLFQHEELRVDVNDDGTPDVEVLNLTVPTLRVDAGTTFDLHGRLNSFNEIITNDKVTMNDTLETIEILTETVRVNTQYDGFGVLSQFEELKVDVNNDATIDVSIISPGTGPEFVVDSGTRVLCMGLADFDQQVNMNSDLIVQGNLSVLGVKSFVEQHPNEPTKEIVYVALEGDEAGTYTRGSAQLKDGVAEIHLPEHFTLVTNQEGLTVQITPRDPVTSMLYVESVTPTLLVVKASNENDKSVKFDFMVNGVRDGFENHQVVREKQSYAVEN